MTTAAILDLNLALGATLTGGTWVRPLENLLDPTVKETTARCVSGNPEDAWFDVVFQSPERWDTLVVAGGTIAAATESRLSWWDHPTARTADHLLAGGPDTPFQRVYPPAKEIQDQDWWDGDAWTGGPTTRDLAGKTPMLITRPASSPRCRAITIEWNNNGRPLDLGHLFITKAFRPDWPHNWGMVIEPVNSSPVDTTPGGRRIPDERPAPVRKTVRFDDLSEDEAMYAFDMGPRLGKTSPLLMIEHIGRPKHQWRRTRLSTLEDGAVRVTQTEGDLWSAEFKLLEIVG